MSLPVFEFSNYRDYLAEWIREKGRGEKSRLAAAARCHIAYVSQILHNKAELSLEQGQAIAVYMNLSEDENDYLLLLITIARAGTTDLKKHYERKLQKVREDRKLLENRLKSKRTLPAEMQATYYSAWYFAAIHVLLTIPDFRRREVIARRLALPVERVMQVLEFLEQAGLAIRDPDGSWRCGEDSIYIGNDSASLDKHHTHWRLRAVHSLDRRDTRDLHYSSVVSLAREDAPKVRKLLLGAVEEIRAVVKPSPEEELYCYTLDLFQV